MSVQDDQEDDDLSIVSQQVTVRQLLVVTQTYIEILRGTLTSAPPRPILHDPFKGPEIVAQWHRGHPDACHDAIGMSAEGLRRLTRHIDRHNQVKPSRTVDLETKIGMTLWMLRKAASNRTTREFWQFSQASVSK